MSLLLKDRVYSMEAPTAKRGVFPLHGFKLGLYRLPLKLDEVLEIQSVHDGLKNTFEMDTYADRIFATYSWTEENTSNRTSKDYEKIDLSVTVEIVTGEVVDRIVAVVGVDGGGCQVFEADPREYVDKLYSLRNQYRNLHGV